MLKGSQQSLNILAHPSRSNRANEKGGNLVMSFNAIGNSIGFQPGRIALLKP